MLVYHDDAIEEDAAAKGGRTHPWDASAFNPNERYYDFKRDPHLIEQVLEDLVPFSEQASVQAFYDMVRWLNGPGSVLETNDCAFRGSEPNKDDAKFKKKLRVRGRLMLFHRQLGLNLLPDRVESLADRIRCHLGRIDVTFKWGCVATSYFPTRYDELTHLAESDRRGYELDLNFWAYGNTADEAFGNFGRTVSNMRKALEVVSAEVKAEVAEEG